MSETNDIGTDECRADWCAGEEWCALACAMEAIGNKWHPVIVQQLLIRGALRFNELSARIDGITNKVLSQSLDDLGESGLVDRDVVSDKPIAVEYSLTDRGRSLEPVIDSLERWGRTHLQRADRGADSSR